MGCIVQKLANLINSAFYDIFFVMIPYHAYQLIELQIFSFI